MTPRIATALVAAALASSPAPAALWNDCGHRVIAAIAHDECDPGTRERVAALLAAHPAALHPSFWAEHEFNGDDPILNLFMNASIFPDEARRDGPFARYDVGPAHYVNYRIVVGPGGQAEVLPPRQDLEDDDPHGDVLESLATNVALVRDPGAPAEQRAVALSWIFHQVGDLHQPLHNVARFCPATPTGDRGGNEVEVLQGSNLHRYWDRALGSDRAPSAVRGSADRLTRTFSREFFSEELAWKRFDDWSREGVRLALRHVYRDLDPGRARFPELPVGYEADARAVAARRATLAGYRLADLLDELFAADGAAPGGR